MEQTQFGQTDRYNSGPFECKHWLRAVSFHCSSPWVASILAMAVWKYLWRAPYKDPHTSILKVKQWLGEIMQEPEANPGSYNINWYCKLPRTSEMDMMRSQVKAYFESEAFDSFPAVRGVALLLIKGEATKGYGRVCDVTISRAIKVIEEYEKALQEPVSDDES